MLNCNHAFYCLFDLIFFLGVALPAVGQSSAHHDDLDKTPGASAENIQTAPAVFTLGNAPIHLVNPAFADPQTLVMSSNLECASDALPSLPERAHASYTAEQENAGGKTGSAGPVIKAKGTKRHHPHLIELTSANWHPLKTSEKFELVWRDLISWETHLSLGVDASISFATNDRDYLGDGFRGWGRRYGINVVDEANFTLMETFIFPTLFHTEPRYIPMNTGTIGRRLAYSVSRVVVARKDSGGYTFNSAKVLETLTAAGLSYIYNSPSERNTELTATLTRAGISIGSDAAFNIFKEFWPDFARKVKLNIWIQNIVRSCIRDVIRVD